MSEMEKFYTETPAMAAVGEVVEGTVVDIDKNSMYIDLSPIGTGIVFGREFLSIKDIIKNINVGDTIQAQVVEEQGYRGYTELSLKEARKATIWQEAANHLKDGTILSLTIKEANKGGLMVTWQGVMGFLPASQLSKDNYPSVSGGDKNRILLELQKLVGEKLDLRIITVDPAEEKLIFTEKKAGEASNSGGSRQNSSEARAERGDLTERFSVGDEIEGEVTGAVDFGVFVRIEDGLEGLVHISEISWSLVEHPENLYKVGDKVNVKVIEVEPNKISLSIKALTANPWQQAAEKYKKDQGVQAVVIRYNEHGALVSVEEGVAGLVHVSDFKDLDELKEKLSLGMTYDFKINVFDAGKQKMTLSVNNAS